MKKDENAVVDAANAGKAVVPAKPDFSLIDEKLQNDPQKLVYSGKTVVSKVVIFGIFGKIKLVILGKIGYICRREVKK